MANEPVLPHQDLPDAKTAELAAARWLADPQPNEQQSQAAQEGPAVDAPRSEARAYHQKENPAAPIPASPISDLVQRLERLQPQIKETDPHLAGAIGALSYSASQPDHASNPHFKTALAYTLEDVEKHHGPLPVESSLRSELSRLATTSPGLENKQLQSLLLLTPTLADRDLVTQLRIKAAEVAGQPDQNTVPIRDDVNKMAYQVLAAPRHQPVAAPAPSQTDAAKIVQQPAQAAEASARETASMQGSRRTEVLSTAQAQMAAFDETPAGPKNNGGAQTSPARPEAAQCTTVSPTSARLPAALAPAGRGVAAAQQPTAVQPSTEPRPARPAALPPAPASPTQKEQLEETPNPPNPVVYKNALAIGGVVGSVLGKVRDALHPQQTDSKPQQPSQAPQADMEQRYAAFEAKRMEPRRDEANLHAADQSARTALDELNNFREGPGASILNRIQDAAKTTQGGMQTVLAEMRPGGAYEDLRKEFNVVLNDNQEFRTAYGRSADALKQYGKDRESVIDTISRYPDANAWTTHFEKLDTEIGDAASNIPGREEGSALENLAEKAREIVEAIINKVRNALGYEARADSRPSPSPSP